MRALQETPEPNDLVATVEERFMSFGPVTGTMGTMGTLGSFMVGANTELLNEPPRVSRRLHSLRGWGHEKGEQVSPGGP